MNSLAPNPLCLEKQFSLRDLFDLSDALVVATDLEQRVVYVNPAFSEVSGYQLSDVVGCMPHYWGSEYTSLEARQKLNEALLAYRAWSGTFVNRRKDGKLWHEQRTVQTLFDKQGVPVGYLSIGFIANEYECQLVRLSTLESQYTLMAASAHELNNMLGVITGLTEVNLAILANSAKNEAVIENLRAVLHAGQQAETLVKRLRRGGQMGQPELDMLNLPAFLNAMRRLLQKTLPSHADFKLLLPSNDMQVPIDESYLLLALTNLLKNAGEAARERKKPEITLTLDISQDGKNAVVAVSDNGHGMSDEQLQYFMEPFFTTKKAQGGTGMGMLQVQELLDTHGGRLEVSSVVNGGTTITLFLPLESAALKEMA
ncbi:ATP-binding protein [Vreelandella aquamarina]|uniref:ATP-binding protein n=1 Tax=Vreelandella aquamarina TaxID=77097 RepID=UPI00384C0B86